MKRGSSHWMLAALLLGAGALGWLACSSDDGGGPIAPSPPELLESWPADGQELVGLQPRIYLVFSEAMDRGSVESATSLEGGRALVPVRFIWIGNILYIEPESPLEFSRLYTLSVGPSAESASGVELSDAWLASFTTLPANPRVLKTDPLDGAADLPLNVKPWIRFTQEMDRASTEAAISIDPVLPLTFEWGGENGDVLTLLPSEDMAPATPYVVTIGTAAQNMDGVHLPADYNFGFETGDASDEDPPAILAWAPPSGATDVPVDFGTLHLSFSEPVNPGTVMPAVLDIRFGLASLGKQPEWNADYSALSVELFDLPAGVEIFIDLGPFADLAGNWSEDPPPWIIMTAGEPDWFPSGRECEWIGILAWSENGLRDTYQSLFSDRIENVSGNFFDLTRYLDWPADPTPRQSQHFTRLSDRIQLRGARAWWYDVEEVIDVSFDPAALWLEIPEGPGQHWEGSGSAQYADFPFPADYEYEGDVLGFEDVSFELDRSDGRLAPWSAAAGRQEGPASIIRDCAKVRFSFEASVDLPGRAAALTVASGLYTLWIAPGVGVVRAARHSQWLRGDDQTLIIDSGEILQQWFIGP